MRVHRLRIREIYSTTSLKTIELEIETDKGTSRSAVPIGTSVGKHESHYLPTEQVIRKFSILRRNFRTQEFEDLEEVDEFLHTIDRTDKFKEIGGNLSLAVSIAFLRAFAKEADLLPFEYIAVQNKVKAEMPMPLCNVAGGWKSHDIQELMYLPVHQKSFKSSIKTITGAYKELADKIKLADPNFIYSKNIESAWASSLPSVKLLELMTPIANKNLLRIGMDVAATELWDGEVYVYRDEKLTRPEQVSFMAELARRFPINYIEDPFHEDEFLGFQVLTHRLSGKSKMVCGDDLFATNLHRLKLGLMQKAANAIIIKPNQVGTITDSINVIKEAQENNVVSVVSHRSGETEDSIICHLAVGMGCKYIKLGISGDRISKINEMLRIEEKMTK